MKLQVESLGKAQAAFELLQDESDNATSAQQVALIRPSRSANGYQAHRGTIPRTWRLLLNFSSMLFLYGLEQKVQYLSESIFALQVRWHVSRHSPSSERQVL